MLHSPDAQPPCVSLAHQASVAPCDSASFGCDPPVAGAMNRTIWVNRGCRGAFQCANSSGRIYCRSRGSTRSHCSCSRSVDGPLRIVIVAHHKSGWTLAAQLFSLLICPGALSALVKSASYSTSYDGPSRSFKRSPASVRRNVHAAIGMCAAYNNYGLQFVWDGLPRNTKLTYEHYTVVHFIRSPIDMIVSGYHYHQRCAESGWTNRSGWIGQPPAWEAAYPALKALRQQMGQRLRQTENGSLADEAVVERSYCLALQRAAPAAALEAEAIRTLAAADGVGKMLEDAQYLRGGRFAGRRLDVCMPDVVGGASAAARWAQLVQQLNGSMSLWRSTASDSIRHEHSTGSQSARAADDDDASLRQAAAAAFRTALGLLGRFAPERASRVAAGYANWSCAPAANPNATER